MDVTLMSLICVCDFVPLGSAAEDTGSRSSSRRSSVTVGYSTELLIDEQNEMTRELEETKKVIQQLQELVSVRKLVYTRKT